MVEVPTEDGIILFGIGTVSYTHLLTISLLDAGHFPLNNWSVLNAYPVKWDISALNSQKNELVIETLEMAYTNLIRMSIRDTEDTKKEQFKQWL